MIIVRAPLRLTFGGAPSDLPSYSSHYGGFCISATINRYCYVAVNRTFFQKIVLKYSEIEETKSIDSVNHPVFREALKLLDFKTPQIEIVSVADVPSNGAGLGNSGAFTVALLQALYQHRHISKSSDEIAELACEINMNKLGKSQGKQDEYASAVGGINCFMFGRAGQVWHYPLNISYTNMIDLQDHLMLFYTNISHNTEEILKKQDKETKENNESMINNLHLCKDLGFYTKNILEQGKLDEFGMLLNAQWDLKEKRMPETNSFLNEIHYDVMKNGAIGSKLIGSGLGGFFLVYSKDKKEVRKYMKTRGLEEMRFQFDFEGCKRMV